jgi:K+-sensing histidine kinase KdpD
VSITTMNDLHLPKDQRDSATDTEAIDFSFVLASSVHDMKNSLGMLLSTINAMMEKSPPKDDEQAGYFSTLEYEAARINTELVQLLSFYRMDEKSIAVVLDEHYVSDVIDEQVGRNDTLLTSRNITVDVHCDSGLSWYFDRELIEGVINNLIVNCARYCKNKLRIDVDEKDGYLTIAVADDGPGYPPSMLLNASSVQPISFSSGNTRLGLVFTRKVLELHKTQGKQGFLCISNDSVLGGGVLTLHLP